MNTKRQPRARLGYSAIAALLSAAACNTEEWALDVGGTATGADEQGEVGENDGEEAEDEGVDEGSTGEVGDGGGDGGSVPCGYTDMLGGEYDVSIPPRDAEHPDYRLFVPGPANEDGDCDFDGIFDPSLTPDDMALGTGHEFEVFVYRPDDGEGDWPEGLDERPAIFFSPGNSLHLVNDLVEEDLSESDHYYRELIRSWVEDGFVVFAMNVRGAGEMASSRRRAALACMMIWARDEWPDRDRLSEYMVLAGHSRGGSGAYILTQHLPDEAYLPEAHPDLSAWQQCALTTYAQAYGDSGPGAVIEPITHDSAPPFLSMQGTIDQDTRTQAITAYDARFEESAAGTVDDWDEVMVVVHGQIHGRWGGANAPTEGPFGPTFTRQFLRWQLMGEDESRRRFMDLIDIGVESCAFDDIFDDLPGSISPPDWTDPLLAIYYTGCSEEPYPDVCCNPLPEPPLDLRDTQCGAHWVEQTVDSCRIRARHAMARCNS